MDAIEERCLIDRVDRRVAAGAANGSAGVDVCVGVGCVVVADDRDGMRHVKQYPAREVARIRKNDDGCLESSKNLEGEKVPSVLPVKSRLAAAG